MDNASKLTDNKRHAAGLAPLLTTHSYPPRLEFQVTWASKYYFLYMAISV